MKCVAIPIAALFLAASPAHADEEDWGKASDIGRNGLVIVAFGLPAVQGDWTGVKQAGLSIGAATAVTMGLKATISEERPDESNDRSFPSRHASMSFAAAATLYKRNGWEIGLPAHAVAAFVGAARVKADKHFVHDVIAGAVIGEAAGWLLTSGKNERVQWLPWGDAHGAGVAVAAHF